MIIKNKTTISESAVLGAMRASNFDNNRYKTFKIIYNVFGLAFGMMLVRSLVFSAQGKGGSTGEILLYGGSALVLLYLGLFGMDRSNRKRFRQAYADRKNRTFYYEIDSSTIQVIDDAGGKEERSWQEIIKWRQDIDYFYLFFDSTACLILDKKGFDEAGAKHLKELATAVMAMKEQEEVRN